jgi:predicted deacylase
LALPGPAQTPEVFVLDSGVPGPRVLVVGGIHGNEPSGALAAQALALGPKPVRGQLSVIPAANPQALAIQQRTAPPSGDGTPALDLNRVFPGQGEGLQAHQAAAIFAVAMSSDLVLDLHEEGAAWPEADLPTLVVSPAAAAFTLDLLEALNTRSPRFTFTGGAPAGSLAGALGAAQRQALVVEVPARLPLQDRLELQRRVLAAALGLLGMR